MAVVMHAVLAVDGLVVVVGQRVRNRRSGRSNRPAYLAHSMRQMRMVAIVGRNVVSARHPAHA